MNPWLRFDELVDRCCESILRQRGTAGFSPPVVEAARQLIDEASGMPPPIAPKSRLLRAVSAARMAMCVTAVGLVIGSGAGVAFGADRSFGAGGEQARQSEAKAVSKDYQSAKGNAEREGWAAGKSNGEIRRMQIQLLNPRTRAKALAELQEFANKKEIKRLKKLAKKKGMRVDQLQDACPSCWGATGADRFRGDAKGWSDGGHNPDRNKHDRGDH